VGELVEGKVVRLTNFGAFVELAEGIEGLIHVSEFEDPHGGEKIELQVDNTYPMKIIKLSPGERKIGLSIRALKGDQDRTDWQSYTEGPSTSQGATLAERLRSLQDNQEE
jgi:small subunit ribosomal protein S1